MPTSDEDFYTAGCFRVKTMAQAEGEDTAMNSQCLAPKGWPTLAVGALAPLPGGIIGGFFLLMNSFMDWSLTGLWVIAIPREKSNQKGVVGGPG